MSYLHQTDWSSIALVGLTTLDSVFSTVLLTPLFVLFLTHLLIQIFSHLATTYSIDMICFYAIGSMFVSFSSAVDIFVNNFISSLFPLRSYFHFAYTVHSDRDRIPQLRLLFFYMLHAYVHPQRTHKHKIFFRALFCAATYLR